MCHVSIRVLALPPLPLFVYGTLIPEAHQSREYVPLFFFSPVFENIWRRVAWRIHRNFHMSPSTMFSFTLNRYDNEFWGQTPKLRWDTRRTVWVYCISSYARTAPYGYDVPCVFSAELMLLHCLQPRYDIIAISQWCKWRVFTCKRGMNKYDALIIPKDHFA